MGLEPNSIRVCAKTGLVVDIYGHGPFQPTMEGKVTSVALRADMDALPISEGN